LNPFVYFLQQGIEVAGEGKRILDGGNSTSSSPSTDSRNTTSSSSLQQEVTSQSDGSSSDESYLEPPEDVHLTGDLVTDGNILIQDLKRDAPADHHHEGLSLLDVDAPSDGGIADGLDFVQTESKVNAQTESDNVGTIMSRTKNFNDLGRDDELDDLDREDDHDEEFGNDHVEDEHDDEHVDEHWEEDNNWHNENAASRVARLRRSAGYGSGQSQFVVSPDGDAEGEPDSEELIDAHPDAEELIDFRGNSDTGGNATDARSWQEVTADQSSFVDFGDYEDDDDVEDDDDGIFVSTNVDLILWNLIISKFGERGDFEIASSKCKL
jgi:hypothetical protein